MGGLGLISAKTGKRRPLPTPHFVKKARAQLHEGCVQRAAVLVPEHLQVTGGLSYLILTGLAFCGRKGFEKRIDEVLLITGFH